MADRREFTSKTRKQALKRSGLICEALGCVKPSFRRCLCSAHYSRLIRHGDIETTNRLANGESLRWIVEHRTFTGDQCLEFPFPRGKYGYGRVTFEGRRTGAHRVMCILAHGQPPTSKHEAAHACGNGHLGCVNPSHLRWATRSENLADRVLHYGGNRGERHGNSKLSDTIVRAIRVSLAQCETQASIASRLRVQQATISKIKRGVAWGWLDG